METIWPVAYQVFPLDFVFEFLVPWTLLDEHKVERSLKPRQKLDESLLESMEKNAGELKREMHEGGTGDAKR